jgi:hypothetical protein
MTQVFPAAAMDTPALSPAWTVQNTATGTNQSLTQSAGAGVNSGQSVGYTPAAHQTATGGASYAGASTNATGTDAANLAKLTDLKALAAKVDALNAALQAGALEA